MNRVFVSLIKFRLSDRTGKKAKAEISDDLRHEYKRSDFGDIVRGKYANQIKEETNVVLLEPGIAQAFPNDEAVNKAL